MSTTKRTPGKESAAAAASLASLSRLDRPLNLVSQVEQVLRKALAEGQFPSHRLPTEKELGVQFGVSRETVRRATESLQRDGLLVKYRSKGTFVASENAGPRLAGLRLAPVASTLLGYVQIDFQNAQGVEDITKRAIGGLMLQGASEEAGQAGFQLAVQHATHPQVARAFEQFRRSVPMRGVIFTDGAEEKLLRRVAGLGLPLVVLDDDVPLPKISSVRDDSFEMGRLAVQHLAELGHRRIAYAPWSRPESNPWRQQGYRQGLRDAQLPRRRAWEIPVSMTQTGARQAVQGLLGLVPRPTALICFNNTLAGMVIEELRRRGLRVPDEVSVMGGGGEEVRDMTCHQIDWYLMGRQAVRILVRSLSAPGELAPEHYLASPILRPGRTTSRPPVTGK